MEIIRAFDDIGSDDVSLVGGKGASLGELCQLGISVPPGFVILTNAFNGFLKDSCLSEKIENLLNDVNTGEVSELEATSERIKALILEAKMSEEMSSEIIKQYNKLGARFVAVRSSATAEDSRNATWAGQLETFLNTTKEDLLDNVKKCWASLFTSRSILYRDEMGMKNEKISVAVVVQSMVESEKSGIAFTVHPITQDLNQMYIEAGLGLGEAIVEGEISPDAYVVDKERQRIIEKDVKIQTRGLYRREEGGNEWRDIDKVIGCTQILTDGMILELSKMAQVIENHYCSPCDIEWAYADQKFFILQSRPITTLGNKCKPKKTFSKFMTREQSVFYSHVWNEANRDLFNKYIPETNIKNMLFLVNQLEVLEVYYDMVELEQFFKRVGDEIITDPSILDQVSEDFYLYWNKIKPYFLKEKAVSDIRELKEFYGNWVRWWAPMAYVFVLPDQEHVPPELRKRALRMREETQEYSDEGDRVFFDFINNVFPDYADIAGFITPEEVWRIEHLTKDEMNIISARKNSCALVTINGISKFGIFDEIKKVLDENDLHFEEVSQEREGDLKGLVASQGYAKGKAILILKKADLAIVEEGDVMVTYATSPDYVAAMKKCAAIVTDEGGIVCHAAIVARELGLPCVVGTKIGTRVIKNGSMVEVDAHLGVVRILED